MAEEQTRPAFYAASPGSPWRDWWTVLHPPYTAWHLAYVVIGAELAPDPKLVPLLATLLAFFLAVGVAAHTLDELHGRPLGTSIPERWLVGAAGVALAGAASVGGLGVDRVGVVLVPFIALGVFLVIAYNVELFGGVLRGDLDNTVPAIPEDRRKRTVRIHGHCMLGDVTASIAPPPA